MLTCQRLACRSVSLFLSIYFCFTAEPCRTDGSEGMKDFSSQSDPYPLLTSHALFPPFSRLGPTRLLKLNDHASRYGTKWTFSPVSKTSFRLVIHHDWRIVYCMLIINGFQAGAAPENVERRCWGGARSMTGGAGQLIVNMTKTGCYYYYFYMNNKITI